MLQSFLYLKSALVLDMSVGMTQIFIAARKNQKCYQNAANKYHAISNKLSRTHLEPYCLHHLLKATKYESNFKGKVASFDSIQLKHVCTDVEEPQVNETFSDDKILG